jgi:hypothetical protein
MRNFFLGLSILAILSNVAIYVLILAALDRRGYKTNIFLARIYIFRYLAAYKEATRKEKGKPGLLYNLSSITLILALISALAAFLIPWS